MRRILLLLPFALALLAACGSEARAPRPAPGRTPPPEAQSIAIARFFAEPAEGRAPLDVTFRWELESPGPVRCELDFDGDGDADRTIERCTGESTAAYRYREAGSHAARLVVRAGGQAAERGVTVLVTEPGAPSIDSFEAAPASGAAPLAVTFGWAISDADGGALVCRLDYDGDGDADETIAPCTSASVASHVYAAGSYEPALEVENAGGRTARASRAVEVAANRPPAIASFTASPSDGYAPLAVEFAWSISDPEGDALSCALDFDSDGRADETIDPCTSSSGADFAYASSGTATLSVTDAHGNAAEAKARITASPRPAVGDLFVSRVEWGQSVIEERLALVAGKDALLRAYVLGSRSGIEGVRARARILSGDTQLGTLPLAGPDAAPAAIDATRLSEQYTAIVPAEWVAPGLRVVVEVDPDDLLAETDEGNNSAALYPAVHETPPLPITAVPVVWGGKTGRAVEVEERITQLWPLHALHVKTRAPFTYTPSGSFDWSELVSDLAAARRADGSARYYVGFVPGMPSSGTVGIGYIGSPTCAVKDDSSGTPDIVAHELGHNFGLHHAPCGTAGDASYPYANARLGTQGWDRVARKIVPPGTAYDLMSYCSPEWVSDYNYENVQDFLESHPPPASTAAYAPGGDPASTPQTESFLVSGTIAPDRIAMRPVHRLAVGGEQPDEGEYALRARTAAGERTVPVALEEPDHGAEGELHFSAVIPAGDGPLLGIELLRGGVPIFERLASGAPAAPPELEDLGHSLRVEWNQRTHPYAAVVFVDAEGERTTLALHLRGGGATLPLHGLAGAGTFEVSLSSGVDAQRFAFER